MVVELASGLIGIGRPLVCAVFHRCRLYILATHKILEENGTNGARIRCGYVSTLLDFSAFFVLFSSKHSTKCSSTGLDTHDFVACFDRHTSCCCCCCCS